MARKCHRQEIGTHFIFFGEQFLGEGCPGALDSKRVQGARHLWATLFLLSLFLNGFSGREIPKI